MVCCLQYREESDSFLVCFLNWVVVKIMYNYLGVIRLFRDSAPCLHLNNKTDTYVGDIQGVGNIGHYSTTPGLSTTSLFDLHISYLLIPEEDCFVIFFLATTLK